MRSQSLLALLVACLALAIPTTATAATVVNGSFETSDLSGWQTYDSDPTCGSWLPYTEGEFALPPQGIWAAFTLQDDCANTSILYQDVSLEAGWTHQLSMYAYYESFEPIGVPSPNSLDPEVEGNQQMRIDVMRPTAPIESVNPADILATVFANKNGDPEVKVPTRVTANLSALGGQAIRLRAAVVAGESFFVGAVDGVSITSIPPLPAPPPPSNAISRGKLTLNKKKGTARLAINVPGPGTLTAIASGKGKTKRIRTAKLTVTAAGAVKVPLNPNGAGKRVLDEKGKLNARIGVTFTPTGGAANTQTYKVTLKKTLPRD